MAEDFEANNIGGCSVLVAQSGQTLYRAQFGENVTEQTLFRLASMTKPITAVATMILVERGLLSLDTTVESFYPAFASMQVRGEDGKCFPTDKKITVEQILTHSSGIGSGDAWVEARSRMTAQDRATVGDFVSFLAKQPLSYVPGTKQEYSGVGAFSVLTGIIERVTGIPYGEFLKKEIFDPCEMRNTTFAPNESQWKKMIPMHGKQDGESVIVKTCAGCVFDFYPTENPLGGAGLISSLEDYWHFAQMLAGGGAYGNTRVLSADSVKAISQPRVPKKSEELWGLAVRVIPEGTSNLLPAGCYGWSGAYGTHFWIDPANEIVAIYLKNSQYDGGAGALTARHLEQDVYSSME